MRGREGRRERARVKSLSNPNDEESENKECKNTYHFVQQRTEIDSNSRY